MASVRKREGKRGVSWICDYVTPDGKRRRKSFKMKKYAEAYKAKVQVDMNEGVYIDPARYRKITLDRLINKYTENFQHQRSWPSKRYHLERIRSDFGGDTLLMNIRFVDLETFRNKLKQTPTKHGKERSDAATNRCMVIFHHLMRKAVEWDMLRESPFNTGKSLQIKENNMRFRYLTEDEIKCLLTQCLPYVKDIVVCAINSGMRYGEIRDLKWSQIRNGHIYLQKTKSNKSRQVPINGDLDELFKSIRARHHLTSEYVFTKDGQRIHHIRTGFKAALRRAGIDNFRFHDLRHTFSSHFIMRGGDLKSLQEILGHSSIVTTQRYAHLAKSHKQAAVNLLNGLTGKSRSSQNVTKSVFSLHSVV